MILAHVEVGENIKNVAIRINEKSNPPAMLGRME